MRQFLVNLFGVRNKARKFTSPARNRRVSLQVENLEERQLMSTAPLAAPLAQLVPATAARTLQHPQPAILAPSMEKGVPLPFVVHQPIISEKVIATSPAPSSANEVTVAESATQVGKVNESAYAGRRYSRDDSGRYYKDPKGAFVIQQSGAVIELGVDRNGRLQRFGNDAMVLAIYITPPVRGGDWDRSQFRSDCDVPSEPPTAIFNPPAWLTPLA